MGMLLGSGMFAYIVGNISEVITAVAGQKIALKEKMRELQEYIVARKLPKEVASFSLNANIFTLLNDNSSVFADLCLCTSRIIHSTH